MLLGRENRFAHFATCGSSVSTCCSAAGRWRRACRCSCSTSADSRPRCLASTRVSRYRDASWVVNALVEATPISGPARVRNFRLRLADQRAFGDIADRQRQFLAERLGVLQRGDGVGRFARLGDRDDQRIGVRHALTIAVFAGDLDGAGQARDCFDPVTGHQPGVVAGAAGEDGDRVDAIRRLLPPRRRTVAARSTGRRSPSPGYWLPRPAARRFPSACSGCRDRARPRRPTACFRARCAAPALPFESKMR